MMEVESSRVCSTLSISSWQDGSSSDCTTVRSTSLCSSPSTPTTMDVNEELSTASESELDSPQLTDNDDQTEDDEDTYSKKRRRKVPPPIFFGTPCQAEHESRARYTIKMQSRRLLRRDSLELARRKSGGFERNSVDDEGARPVTSEEDDLHNERELSPALDSSTSKQASDDSSSEKEDGSGDTESEDEGIIGGDKTIKLQYASEGDLPEDELPSTPTEQVIRTVLSRPSLAISEADSSPGIALALHSSSATQASSFSRTSPGAVQLERTTWQSPRNYSPPKFQADVLEWEKDRRTTPARQNTLKESPNKLNQTISPLKNSHLSSPTKVVVRQTLSAWAHSKLKTPQSPEKKEWEKLQQIEAISPSRSSKASLQSNNASERVGDAPNVSRLTPSATSSQGQTIRPPSRIARPVPPSRLPIPKPAATTVSTETAKRIAMPSAGPSFRRIVTQNTASSSPRPLSVTASSAGPSRPVVQAAAAAPKAQNKVPFRAPLNLAKPLDRSLAVFPTVTSSSPVKAAKPMTAQRCPLSSPSKRPAPVKSAVPPSSAPIVRDARLIAAPRRIPESGPLPSPSTVNMNSSSSIYSSSPSGTPVQASAGIGGARRVMVGKEPLQPMEAIRARVTARPEKVDMVKRGIRIKEITMGRNVTPAQSPLKEIILSPAKVVEQSILGNGEESITPEYSELEKTKRQARRKQEKPSTGKVRKVTPSSSIFPSSASATNEAVAALPLSKADLSRLTSLHTRRNEMFVSQLETIIVRKKGENRPASPSSKIRKSISDNDTRTGTQSIAAKESAKEARERRARKRSPEVGEIDEVEEKEKHKLGAGDDDIYLTPPRNQNQTLKRIRWHKSLLFCGPSDVNSVRIESPASAAFSRSRVPLKSCLCKKAFTLDILGNVVVNNQALSPRLTKNKVTIYKLIYDDDEDQYL